MRAFGILAGLTVLAACGGGARKMTPAFATGAEVRISDGGQIYDALNTTDCIRWPSPKVKEKAGRSGWGSFHPGAGNEGKVVAALAHCDGKTQVVLVEVGPYVVPVTSQGVEAKGGGGAVSEEIVGLGGLGYGGFGYGGFDVYGEGDYTEGISDWADFGVEGGVAGGMVGGGYYPGDAVEIVEAGEIFTDINTGDCITWPDEATKKQGGQSSWGKYYPAAGDVGTVLHVTYRCGDNVEILILDVAGKIVPIKSLAVTLVY